MVSIHRILLLVLLALPLYGENSLGELLEKTGSRLSWNPYSRQGTLERDSRQVRFQVDNPYLLLDEDLEEAASPEMQNRQVFFPHDTFNRIAGYLLNSEMTQDKDYEVSVILLDPGHGGKDWGAYRQYQVDGISTYLREKNINLDVGLRVAEILRQRFPDKEISLTRSDDRFVSLQQRVDAAEKYSFSPTEGMIFLSIHTNASMNTRGTGFEVWYLPDSFDRDLAEEEGNELNQVLNSLWEEVFNRENYNLSRFILENMDEQNGEILPNRGLKQNAWYMLRNQNMASCLIELAFLTNPEDASLLRDTEHLKRSSLAIADGITDFIEYFENQ